jgi:hypothetical protein
MLRNQVGFSNDLASLLYSRSLEEIITSRTPSAETIVSRTLLSEDNNFTDTLASSMQQCNVIFYGRLKKKIFLSCELVFIKRRRKKKYPGSNAELYRVAIIIDPAPSC